MARGAYNFCPRDQMPMPTLETTESALNPPIHTPMQPAADVMTWQQQKQFGHLVKPSGRNPGRAQWTPFDSEAIETIAADKDNTWLAQQAEFPTPGPRRKPRGKATTPSSTRHLEQPTPAEPSPPKSAHYNDAHEAQATTRKRSARKAKKNQKDSNMAPLRQEAYVPPHLRKRSAVIGTKRDSAVGLATANGSPAVSDKSKTDQAAQLHSSPNGANHLPSSPPSPPTTPQEPEKLEDGGWAGWDAPKPDVPAPSKKLENPRWPRAKPYKKTVWPKSRDMKPLPTESGSDGGVSFKSNSNGDPDYDIKKLLDWNGDWLPPPEQWSARKGYTNRHFGQAMEQWMTGHAEECCRGMDLSSDAFRGREIVNGDEVEYSLNNYECKELVPRYWLQTKVEKQTLREFWKDLPNRAPEALSDVDIMADPPWWDRYEDEPSCFLNGLVVPEARVDPADVENHLHPYLMASATDRLEDIRMKEAEKARRRLARRNRPLPESKFPVPQLEDKRIRPRANVYLRPVQPADVRGIAELYNHYVEKTIYANEFDGRTEAQIRDRINDITAAGLPYLVAIAKGNQPRGRQGYVSEKIVGYINLDDYCDQSSMYRFTFEMELFVHPGFTSKGIAKCLLDRLLEMANTGYNARGGYEYINEFEYLKTGPSRIVKTIHLNVHHEHGGDIQHVIEYLDAFKFVRCGRLSQVGFKHDKVVDVSIFQHHTTENIDPKSIPTVPLERN